MIIVFVEIPLDERSNILTFPALIAFDRVNSLMGDFTNLAEWANHSFRTSVVATDPTTSRSNRAGTSFAAGFPDILTPGTHESLLHHFLFFFLFLTQNVVIVVNNILLLHLFINVRKPAVVLSRDQSGSFGLPAS